MSPNTAKLFVTNWVLTRSFTGAVVFLLPSTVLLTAKSFFRCEEAESQITFFMRGKGYVWWGEGRTVVFWLCRDLCLKTKGTGDCYPIQTNRWLSYFNCFSCIGRWKISYCDWVESFLNTKAELDMWCCPNPLLRQVISTHFQPHPVGEGEWGCHWVGIWHTAKVDPPQREHRSGYVGVLWEEWVSWKSTAHVFEESGKRAVRQEAGSQGTVEH